MNQEQKEVLAQEFREWFSQQTNKVQITKEALDWAENKHLISKNEIMEEHKKGKEAFMELAKRAVTMWWLDQRKKPSSNQQ